MSELQILDSARALLGGADALPFWQEMRKAQGAAEIA